VIANVGPVAGGWRIGRVPGKRVRRDEDGRITVPLWLLYDGTYHSDLDLRLSPAEAESLHAQLAYALDGLEALDALNALDASEARDWPASRAATRPATSFQTGSERS
jgi:hypothetical protein